MGEPQKNKRQDLNVNSKSKSEMDEKRKFRRNSIAVTIVIAVLVIFSALIKSDLMYSKFAAVKVGSYSYTAADFNYQYYSTYYRTYNSISSTYGELASSIIDTSKPLNQQPYSEDKTWADYFKEEALSNLQQISILENAAKAEGYTLTDSDKDAINSTIEGYKGTYKSSGYSSLKAFLEANFGKGVTEKVFRSNLERQYLVSGYYNKMMAAKTYTNEELDSYYNANKDKFDSFTYRQYFVSGAADEANGITADTAMASAKAIADKIVAAKNESDFNKLVYANAPDASKESYKDGAGTLKNSQTSSSFTTGTSDWLLDGSRALGNATVIESTNGYYVLFFISRSDNSYKLKDVRHILISPAASTTDEEKAKADADAKAKAQEIYTKWLSGDKSESSFAALATENSTDTGSEGGYYEVHKGQMVEPFETWAFDQNRKPGDSGIVQTTYGYHIMYFVGEGELYRYTLARDDKKTSDYNTWFENQQNSFEVKQTSFMRFAA